MKNYEEIKALLKQALGKAVVDYCEVRFEDSREKVIQFQGTELETVQSNNLYGGNIRALHKGGWGFACFNNLEDLEDNLMIACDQAIAAGEAVRLESMLAPAPVVEDDFCPHWTLHPEAVSLDEKIRILGHYHKLVLSYENIPASTVLYQERCTTLVFANSEGTFIRQEKLDFAGGIIAQGRKGDVSVSQNIGFGSSLGIDKLLGLDEKIMEMCERTQKLLDAPPIKAGVYTVICDPTHTGLFVHEAFGHLSEADDLAKNPDFLKAMTLGRTLGRPILNMYDTGDIFESRGGLKYDDEGVLCRRAELVKEGKLVGRLHNRWSAAFLGEDITGSARALTYVFPPITRMRNTSIEAGDSSFEDMLKDVELGVYAVGSGGGETNGEMFNFAASYGRMIRNGKLAELVRDVKLMGNVFTTLENIDMIGNDASGRNGPGGCGKGSQAPLPTSGHCPHIRIQNVVVGGVKV
jgi:TldD protein